MGTPFLFSQYLLWHYSIALADLFRVWGNFLWFDWHFFSIPLLFKTLLSPWRRLGETKKQSGFHPEEFFGDLIVNSIMRLIGVFARLFMIIMGLALFAIILVLGVTAFLIWFLMPVLIPFLFLLGLRLVFG